MLRLPRLLILFVLVWCGVSATTARAQDANDRSPSFSVATDHVFTTKERAALMLTYRQLDHLDFRVYRINDSYAFFEKLRDPHQLGSEEPLVPQEQTWLERIAGWKANWRSEIRSFAKLQVSWDYRVARHEQRDKQQVVLRQALNVNSFAQVPLLNASQLV